VRLIARLMLHWTWRWFERVTRGDCSECEGEVAVEVEYLVHGGSWDDARIRRKAGWSGVIVRG
jgi:hypothetical protein